MSEKLLIYFRDINEAITSIEMLIEGLDYKQFLVDDKTASAVIRKFEIIEEATKKIPEYLRNSTLKLHGKISLGCAIN